jgi:hypothetical protein
MARRLFAVCTLILFTILALSAGARAQGSPGVSPGQAPATRALAPFVAGKVQFPTQPPAAVNATWAFTRVDAPKYFATLGSRALALDPQGHPHVAYGEDHLYHAWHDGSQWHYETVDPAWGVGAEAAIALDAAGRTSATMTGPTPT